MNPQRPSIAMVRPVDECPMTGHAESDNALRLKDWRRRYELAHDSDESVLRAAARGGAIKKQWWLRWNSMFRRAAIPSPQGPAAVPQLPSPATARRRWAASKERKTK